MKKIRKKVAYIVYAIGVWIGFWAICVTMAYIYILSKNDLFSVMKVLPLLFSYVISGIVYSLMYTYFIKNRVIDMLCENDKIILRTIKQEYIFKNQNIEKQFYRKVDNSVIIIIFLNGKKIRLRIPNMKTMVTSL